MRYALVGCGRVSPNHIKAAKENGFEILSVCDIDDRHIDDMFSRAVECGKENIRRYSDFIEMYEKEKPELISIALPSSLHAVAAIEAIKRGIHVIIEKPMAMSIEDADEIIRLSELYNVKVSACHQNRFNIAVQEMRAALEKGRFGTLSNAAITVRWSRDKSYYDQAQWRGKFESDGGTLMNQCIHGIDLLIWMCGNGLRKVYGATRRQYHPYIEAEDAGTAVFEFENGVIATVEGTVNVPGGNLEEHLTLIGQTGIVKLGGKSANAIDVWRFSDDPNDTKDGFHEKTTSVYGNGHSSLFSDVADAIKNDRKPYVDAKAGKRALEAVLAIYKSMSTGLPVELPLESCAGKDFEGMFD
ncbi:MAG: Gfo/Idh/MocA family oxidoreductase [Clostridia bacterium]|nr:Gfo/Idh/MocA family oxidoreductase [Clostridia bacterium]